MPLFVVVVVVVLFYIRIEIELYIEYCQQHTNKSIITKRRNQKRQKWKEAKRSHVPIATTHTIQSIKPFQFLT